MGYFHLKLRLMVYLGLIECLAKARPINCINHHASSEGKWWHVGGLLGDDLANYRLGNNYLMSSR